MPLFVEKLGGAGFRKIVLERVPQSWKGSGVGGVQHHFCLALYLQVLWTSEEDEWARIFYPIAVALNCTD
jgi:hypothetical protein